MNKLLVIVVVIIVLSSCMLFAVEVGAMPGAEFADTEVSTNVALSVGAARNRRLVFSVELQASPSNNVEVAVGCDADADGRLSLAESALVVGYDCGEWFVRSAAKDSAEIVAVSDSGTFRRVYELRSRRVDPSWNLVMVTRRGFGATNERVAVEPTESGFALRLN